MSTVEQLRRNRLYARVLIVQVVLMVIIVVSIWISSYQGRVNLVDSQLKGCERGKLDREANAEGWRTAEARATSQHQPQFAKVYDDIAAGLEQRSRVKCSKAYPKPKLVEFR